MIVYPKSRHFTLNHKYQPFGGARGKLKVNEIHPLGTMNVRTNFCIKVEIFQFNIQQLDCLTLHSTSRPFKPKLFAVGVKGGTAMRT